MLFQAVKKQKQIQKDSQLTFKCFKKKQKPINLEDENIDEEEENEDNDNDKIG
ncbi:MAG: hypothetical protein KME30_17165 [Iphinoe sp. HA4291-MV1]|jgi:hypothetical protein|nr:hypothetical protein [Iphinoe sp. HA4291-MV1]